MNSIRNETLLDSNGKFGKQWRSSEQSDEGKKNGTLHKPNNALHCPKYILEIQG